VDEKNPPKKYPIELGEPRVETSISTITLPDGWGAESPKDVHEKAVFAIFDKTYKLDHNVLTVERRVEILQSQLPAADWKTYKKWLDATTSDREPSVDKHMDEDRREGPARARQRKKLSTVASVAAIL
jgi:hypothetical protein